MRPVLRFFCVVLPATILALKCGLPGRTVHGILKPEKLAYEAGEVVQTSCKEGFEMTANENDGKQTCVGGIWDGNRPTCLKNLAFKKKYIFRSNNRHFGKSNVQKLYSVSEQMYIQFKLPESVSNNVHVIFRGSFTARIVSNGSVVPLSQNVFAWRNSNAVFCPPEKDYYRCISSPPPFIAVTVKVTLQDQNFDLRNNPVEVVLQLKENGFKVVDYSNIECGTPAEPLHGSVTITRVVAVFECDPGYQLKGLNTAVCDTSKEDGNLWPRGNPLCLETKKPGDSKQVDIAMMAGLIAAVCVVMVLLIIGMCCLYLKIERRNTQREANRFPMVPVRVHSGANVSQPDILLPPLHHNLMYPSPVQYPLIVSDLYSPESAYSSSLAYGYDDEGNQHIYERLD